MNTSKSKTRRFRSRCCCTYINEQWQKRWLSGKYNITNAQTMICWHYLFHWVFRQKPQSHAHFISAQNTELNLFQTSCKQRTNSVAFSDMRHCTIVRKTPHSVLFGSYHANKEPTQWRSVTCVTVRSSEQLRIQCSLEVIMQEKNQLLLVVLIALVFYQGI